MFCKLEVSREVLITKEKIYLFQPKSCLITVIGRKLQYFFELFYTDQITDGSAGSFSESNWDAPHKNNKTTPEGVFLVTCFVSVTACNFCDHFVLPDCVALGTMGRKIHLSVNTPRATCCHSRLLHVSLFPEN